MALSGNIYGTTANQYITPRLTWSATQNVANNTSTITASLYYTRTNSGSDKTMGSWRGSITIDGETFNSGYNKITITNSGYTLAYSVSKTITHNSDGNRTCAISATGHISGTSLSSTSVGSTITLDRIPRNATIDSAPNFTDEQNPTITYTNRAGTAVTTLQACLSFSGDIDIPYRDISKTGTSYTFELTAAERDIIRAKYNTATSGPIIFYIKTVIGGYTYYSKLQKTVSIVNANPTQSPTAVDTNSATVALTGNNKKIVRYHSDVAVTTNAVAKKKATLKSYKIVNGNRNITTATGTFNDCEVGSFVFTTTDSRGLEVQSTVNLDVVPYVNLSCNAQVGMPTTDGKVSVEITGNYFGGSFGATSNNLTVSYRYKENDGAYGAWTDMPKTISGTTYTATVALNNLNYLSSYTFQARAVDKIQTVYSIERTVKTTPVFDWSKEDFKFNVPVSFKADVVNTATVYGLTSTGAQVAALETCNSSNCLNLGKGGYDNYLGATNIYGNKINLNSRDGVFVDGVQIGGANKVDKVINAMSNTYLLECETLTASGYERTNASAELIGNTLRCYIWGRRNSSTESWGSYDEVIAYITVHHGGKIKDAAGVNFTTGMGDWFATFEVGEIDCNETTLTFAVYLCVTGYPTLVVNSLFALPVTINIDAY